jgi:hypothetical protein
MIKTASMEESATAMYRSLMGWMPRGPCPPVAVARWGRSRSGRERKESHFMMNDIDLSLSLEFRRRRWEIKMICLQIIEDPAAWRR